MHRAFWWLPGFLAAAIILTVCFGPLLALLQEQTDAPMALWHDPYLVHVAWFSIQQATYSTILSLLLAIPMARGLFYLQFPGKSLLLHLFSLSQVLPVIIALFGIVAVHGANGWLATFFSFTGVNWPNYLFGLSGILLAHVFFNMPLATRWCVQALETIPENYWRQSDTLGFNAWQRFKYLEWPAMARLLPGLASLIFMLCFTSFTIVMALGGGPQSTTLEVAIYQALRFDFDLAAAGQLACWQLILGLLVIASYTYLKPAGLNQTAWSLQHHLARPVSWLTRLVVILGSSLFVTPLLATCWYGIKAIFTLQIASYLLWQATFQSLQIAICAGVITLIFALALLISSRHLIFRKQSPHSSQMLAGTGSLILLIPTSVLSTGIFILLQAEFDLFSHGWGIVTVLNAVAALPYSIRALQQPMTDVLQRYDRLADSLGLAGFSRLRLLEWPLLCRPAGRALALGMVFSLGDLAAVAMFGSDTLKTLPWLLYQQLGRYQMQEAAATALVLLTLCMTLLWCVEWLANRQSNREPPSLMES